MIIMSSCSKYAIYKVRDKPQQSPETISIIGYEVSEIEQLDDSLQSAFFQMIGEEIGKADTQVSDGRPDYLVSYEGDFYSIEFSSPMKINLFERKAEKIIKTWQMDEQNSEKLTKYFQEIDPELADKGQAPVERNSQKITVLSGKVADPQKMADVEYIGDYEIAAERQDLNSDTAAFGSFMQLFGVENWQHNFRETKSMFEPAIIYELDDVYYGFPADTSLLSFSVIQYSEGEFTERFYEPLAVVKDDLIKLFRGITVSTAGISESVVKPKDFPGYVSEVLSSKPVTDERKMQDVHYINGYEVETTTIANPTVADELKNYLSTDSMFIPKEVLPRCKSVPEVYVELEQNVLYGFNISSGCPMFFTFENGQLKRGSVRYIRTENTELLREILFKLK